MTVVLVAWRSLTAERSGERASATTATATPRSLRDLDTWGVELKVGAPCWADSVEATLRTPLRDGREAECGPMRMLDRSVSPLERTTRPQAGAVPRKSSRKGWAAQARRTCNPFAVRATGGTLGADLLDSAPHLRSERAVVRSRTRHFRRTDANRGGHAPAPITVRTTCSPIIHDGDKPVKTPRSVAHPTRGRPSSGNSCGPRSRWCSCRS